MAQQVKILTTKPNNLSSIPQTHMVKGDNYLTQGVISALSTHTIAFSNTLQYQTYILNK